MPELNTILNSFEPISLKEMDNVKLMNRTDRKFCFHIDKLRQVLQLVTTHYKILEVEKKRVSRYKTLYYDTVNYDLYRFHQNGKLNRFKLRHRTYVESDLGFLEVKFKSNKGRTIKSRISKNNAPYPWEDPDKLFIRSKLIIDPADLVPAIWVNFNRLTLVNKTNAERLTLDLNLEFIKNDSQKSFDQLVIAEVKQEKKANSPFLGIMKQFHIREGSVSKYVMGIALTCDHVKINNFKAKLRTISNIYNDSSLSFASS